MRSSQKVSSQARPPAAARQGLTGARASISNALLASLLLIVLTVVVYAPVGEAGYIWDDDSYVAGNLTLRTTDGLRRIWLEPAATPQYYPLVHTTFWIEYHLWNLSPRGFHLVNVALHAANAVLVWRLLSVLRVPGAWWGAALFAVHPVMVESVAWITERKNVLSLALALCSLHAYFRFAPPDEAPVTSRAEPERPQWMSYAAALLFFLAALLSKTVVATVPAVIVVVSWWKRRRVAVQDVLPLAPFFALGISCGLFTAWMEKHHVGAGGAEWSFSVMERVLISGRVLCFYAAKLLFPYPLSFFYPRFSIDAATWWQYLFPLSAVAVIVMLWWQRTRLGRGPLAAVLIFAGVLTPALGFVDVYPFRFSFVADHFQYHASIALLALIAAAGVGAYARLDRVGRNALLAASVAVLGILCVITFERVKIFQNVESLYRDTIAKNPAGPTAYANLAVYLESVGRVEEALQLARDAVRLGPDEATAHNTLGICLVRLAGKPPGNAALLTEGIAQLQEALRLFPQYADAHVNLGLAYLASGKSPNAVQQFEAALEKNPQHADAHYALAGVLAQQGRLDAAAEHYVAAIAARPEFDRALNNLGVVRMNQGEVDQAIEYFEAAARANPAYAEAQANLEKARQVRRQKSTTP